MTSWTKPTAEQVTRAVAKLGRLGTYRYFFQRLENPEWIEPLWKNGYFRSPPAPVRDEVQNTVSFPSWPESAFLVRMASQKPELVANIVRTLDTENVQVQEDLIDIALQLPARLAIPIAQKAKQWARTSYRFWLTERLAKLVVYLTRANEVQQAFNIVFALLDIHADSKKKIGEETDRAAEPSSQDLWEIEEFLKICLPALRETDCFRTLRMLSDLLEKDIWISYQSRIGTVSDDYSYVWREAIESREEYSHDLANLLVDAVRDTAAYIANSGCMQFEELMAELERREFTIFRRVALHTLANIGPKARDFSADRLLDRSLFDQETIRHEYEELLKSRFHELTSHEQERILEWIMSGPDLDQFKVGYTNRHYEPPTDSIVEEYRQRWIRDWLLAFGEHLPATLRPILDELNTVLGTPAPKQEKIWVGPTSPVSADELREMGAIKTSDLLRNWKPEGEYRSPSPAGLALELQKVAKEQAAEFGTKAEAFIGLQPTYVRAIISGLTDAATADAFFPWEPVLSLCNWATKQPRGVESASAFSVQDSSWEGTRKAVARLLNSALRMGPNPVPFNHREPIWLLISTLLTDPDPTQDEEARQADAFEATTTAINSVRGEAIQAAIRYGLWIKRALDVGATGRAWPGFAAMPELQTALEQHLDIRVDPSLAIRALYGQYFPWLVLLDRKWAAASVDRIFPVDKDAHRWWTAAWGGYIKFCNPYDDVFEILKPKYEFALQNLRPIERREERMQEHLAAHLMVYYWRGKISLEPDDLVQRFFVAASPRAGASALEFVGRSLISTKEPIPDRIIVRLKNLWSWQVEAVKRAGCYQDLLSQLGSFSSWFSSGQFDAGWSLTQLYDVLRLAGPVRDTYRVAKQLAKYVKDHPRLTANCLKLQLSGKKAIRGTLSGRKEVGEILQFALESEDVEARSVAREIIHYLGEMGWTEYGELL